jgi:acyl carrier protein
VVLDVEDVFDIELNNKDMEELRTVNDAIRIIGAKINSKT